MTPERKMKFLAALGEASLEDLYWVQEQITKKVQGGFNRIAETEAEVAKESLLMIDTELELRKAGVGKKVKE